MTGHRLPRVVALAAIVTAMLFASACTAADGSGTPPAEDSPSASEETSAPDVTDAAPTCEAIIPDTVVSELRDVGWTVQSEEFRIGGTVIEGGIQCTWADYTVATDHVQIYGWAPIADDAASEAQDELVSQGWVLEEDGDAVYVTENPDFVISPDSDGYGMTYLFRDGSVKLADTKQSLLLVEWQP